ncbi:MAG: hypothetical protein MK097_04035 [Dechloromonas sp.]|nr:hypothetical protein [Dechloromonas sp.]
MVDAEYRHLHRESDRCDRQGLDLFEPQISAEPATTASVARQYVAERRTEIELLRNRTYTQADGVAATAASARLDELCGAS